MAPKKKKNKEPGMAIGIIIVGSLLVVAAIVLLLSQGNAASQPITEQPAVNIPYPDIKRVSLKDAKTAFDQGQAVFLDVRSVESFNAARIPGAVSIPLGELEGRFTELSKDDWIIPYCT